MIKLLRADLSKAQAADADRASLLYTAATAMQSFEMVQKRNKDLAKQKTKKIQKLIEACVPKAALGSRTKESSYARRVSDYITMDQPLFLQLRQQAALAYVGFRTRTVQLLNKWSEELAGEGNLLAHQDSLDAIQRWEQQSVAERTTQGGHSGPCPRPTRVPLHLKGRLKQMKQRVFKFSLLLGQQSRFKKTKTDLVTRLKKAKVEARKAGKKKKKRKLPAGKRPKKAKKPAGAAAGQDRHAEEPVHASGDAGRAENTTLGAVEARSVEELEERLERVEAKLREVATISKEEKFNKTQQKVAFKSLWSHKKKARDALELAGMNLVAVEALAVEFDLTNMKQYATFEIRRTDSILATLNQFDLSVVAQLQELGLSEEQIST